MTPVMRAALSEQLGVAAAHLRSLLPAEIRIATEVWGWANIPWPQPMVVAWVGGDERPGIGDDVWIGSTFVLAAEVLVSPVTVAERVAVPILNSHQRWIAG